MGLTGADNKLLPGRYGECNGPFTRTGPNPAITELEHSPCSGATCPGG